MFNNGILFIGVIIPKLLNNPSASCSFINLDFLLPKTTHFDDKANLPFLLFIDLFFYYGFVSKILIYQKNIHHTLICF